MPSVNFTNTAFSLPLRDGFATAAVSEIAVADFNGDGKLDIYLAYLLLPLEDRAVPGRLLLGDGRGGFTDGTAVTFTNGAAVDVHSRQILVADFNGDQRPDIFVADHGYDAPPFPGARDGLMLSTGTSQLTNASAALPGVADFTHSSTAGDVDGDGDIDIFKGNSGYDDAGPYLLLNNGAGVFTISFAGLPARLFAPNPQFDTCLLFDADGDGDLDLFTGPVNARTELAVIYRNDGRGNFLDVLSTFSIVSQGNIDNVVESKAVDINGDGKLDLIVSVVKDGVGAGSIRIYINDGAGHFTDETATRIPQRVAETWTNRVYFADMNGDGAIDMVAMNGTISPIFLNDGTGIFHEMPGLTPQDQFGKYYAADFNGDGRVDLFAIRGLFNGAEQFAFYAGADTPAQQIGDASANGLMGDNDAETLLGMAGADVIFGGGGNDYIDGGADADYLHGGAGDDTLVGGNSVDTLVGGKGSDVYLVQELGDVVVELRGEGTADTLYTTVGYALPGDAEIENFAAANASSTVGLMLTGNQFGQAIAGTFGNDTITGAGSSVNGGDILIGLRGDDLYIVDAPNILLIENVGEGNDTATILAGASGFILNDGEVENLIAQTGTASINITGNLSSQRIVGNSGNNLLSTGGGGADTLDGGLGDDTYRVHGTVAIADSGGNDAIYTSGTFRLFSNAAIELITTAVQAGTDAIDVTGNDFGQLIIGNYGTNVLDGRGGNDTLIGLQGADTFAFTSALGAGNVDLITDFASGTDRIGLASDVFAGVTSGGILASEFVVGTAATTADTRLIYNQSSGQLFYDADANGSGAAVLFAQLGAGTALTAADFVAVAPTS